MPGPQRPQNAPKRPQKTPRRAPKRSQVAPGAASIPGMAEFKGTLMHALEAISQVGGARRGLCLV